MNPKSQFRSFLIAFVLIFIVLRGPAILLAQADWTLVMLLTCVLVVSASALAWSRIQKSPFLTSRMAARDAVLCCRRYVNTSLVLSGGNVARDANARHMIFGDTAGRDWDYTGRDELEPQRSESLVDSRYHSAKSCHAARW